MATAVQAEKKVYPAHGDAIRIVPLHVADAVTQPTVEAAAAPAVAPHLTYRNGPLLGAVEVFTIFWGPLWQQAAQNAMVGQINQFFDFILTSPLIDQLAEYNVPGYAIGHGRCTGSSTITTPSLKHSVSDTAIQHMLQQDIPPTPRFLTRHRILYTSFTWNRELGRPRRLSVLSGVLRATTTTSQARSSTRRRPTRAAGGNSHGWPFGV